MTKRVPAYAPIDRLCVDTIRTLAMDAIEHAKSGHPGMPMAMAPVAFVLWQRHLRYDPQDPSWPDRDRFVLSAGHGSALLYAMLHLCEVGNAVTERDISSRRLAVTLDDLRRFRRLDSVCAGHPEYGLTAGVECTTGPLGQGVAMSVGMAIAARRLGALYNRTGCELFAHRVWALCGDGDLMEGISTEAAALAGHLRLGNLAWIYDSNRITIEGSTDLAWSEDVAGRFTALGWRILEVADANDLEALDRAFAQITGGDRDGASDRNGAGDRPALLIVHSRIGYGAPHKEGTSAAHGEPLGEEELRGAKRSYGWPEEPRFLVPDGVYEQFRAGIGSRGQTERAAWQVRHQAFRRADPAAAAELDDLLERRLPEGWDQGLPNFPPDPKGVATRTASGKALNAIAARIPCLLGGSADLHTSVKTLLDGECDLSATTPLGRNLHFGIREHAMGAILNGLSLSGIRPFGSTFLVFSDYLRPALRLSAIMKLPVAWVFSHDSIFAGEDGPTHQPIEHLAALRAIPGLVVLRPADANEAVEAWRLVATLRDQPAALVLSRQNLPVFDRACFAPAGGLARGGYVLAEAPGGKPRVILIGTGSEVSLCLDARELLLTTGIVARVVSLPSWDLFERQDETYRASVLPPDVTERVTVEAGSPLGWERYAGPGGVILAMRSFGASAPAGDLARRYGFTAEAVAEAARLVLG
jgi:transketolase